MDEVSPAESGMSLSGECWSDVSHFEVPEALLVDGWLGEQSNGIER